MNEPQGNRILRALLRAGKAKPTLDTARVELGFDTRLLTTIRERRSVEDSPWLVWHRVVWRFVPGMTAVAIGFGIFCLVGADGNGALLFLGDPLGLELALANYLGGSL